MAGNEIDKPQEEVASGAPTLRGDLNLVTLLTSDDNVVRPGNPFGGDKSGPRGAAEGTQGDGRREPSGPRMAQVQDQNRPRSPFDNPPSLPSVEIEDVLKPQRYNGRRESLFDKLGDRELAPLPGKPGGMQQDPKERAKESAKEPTKEPVKEPAAPGRQGPESPPSRTGPSTERTEPPTERKPDDRAPRATEEDPNPTNERASDGTMGPALPNPFAPLNPIIKRDGTVDADKLPAINRGAMEFVPNKERGRPPADIAPKPGDVFVPPVPRKDSTDQQPDVPSNGGVQTPERVQLLYNMDNAAAAHGKYPDALVRIPKNFDPSKPVNVVIYSHGWRDTITTSYNSIYMNDQMEAAPPNTVLIMPEWQRSPGAESGNQGTFSQPNQFRKYLQEVFDKTPELRGKKIDDIGRMDVFSHSAGDNATLSIVNKNGLGSKITSLNILDSMFNTSRGYDDWIQQNIHQLFSGEKQFRNVYFVNTDTVSNQASRVADMLKVVEKDPKKRAQLVHIDDSNDKALTSAKEFANHSIYYKYSRIGGGETHAEIPKVFIREILGGAKIMRSGKKP